MNDLLFVSPWVMGSPVNVRFDRDEIRELRNLMVMITMSNYTHEKTRVEAQRFLEFFEEILEHSGQT